MLVAVQDLEHVRIRITSLSEAITDSDEKDVNLAQFAHDNSVVELLTEGKVTAQIVQTRDVT